MYKDITTGVPPVTVASSTLSAVISALASGSTYHMSVVASNSVGSSPASATHVHKHVLADRSAAVRVVLVRSNAVLLEWDSPAPSVDATLLSYRVYVSGVLFQTVGPDTTSLVVTGLTSSRSYTLSLRPTFSVARRLVSATDRVSGRELATEDGTETSLNVETTASSNTELIVTLPQSTTLRYLPDDESVVEIWPAQDGSVNTMEITFTAFDVECDHDVVSVWSGATKVWTGGCHRQQEFTITMPVPDPGTSVYVTLAADDTVTGTGVDISIRAYLDVTGGAGLQLGSPEACPGLPDPCTSAVHGACMVTGKCECNAGYTEDCSAHVLCPGPLCALALEKQGPAQLAVVAQWGSDTSGTGWVGSPVTRARGGTVPKPFASLAHARSVMPDNATILMFPGTYTGACGVTIDGWHKQYTIVGALQAGARTHDAEPTVVDWTAKVRHASSRCPTPA